MSRKNPKRRKLFVSAEDERKTGNWDNQFGDLKTNDHDIEVFSDSDEENLPFLSITTKKERADCARFAPNVTDLNYEFVPPPSQTSIGSFESDSAEEVEIAPHQPKDPPKTEYFENLKYFKNPRSKESSASKKIPRISTTANFNMDGFQIKTSVSEVTVNIGNICNQTKRATAWLNDLKSPPRRQPTTQVGLHDDSAAKAAKRKHAPGSLAYKVQRLSSYITGEYHLWYHKNIISGLPIPVSEFCYFGVAESLVKEFGVWWCRTLSYLGSPHPVTVIYPDRLIVGEFQVGTIFVVFPEFEPFLRGGERYILARFHCQFVERETIEQRKDLFFVDHFLGVIPDPDEAERHGALDTAEKTGSTSVTPVSEHDTNLTIIVRHVKVNGDHVEVAGTGSGTSQRGVIIVEIAEGIAREWWPMLGLCYGRKVMFSLLQGNYRGRRAIALQCIYPYLRSFGCTPTTPITCYDVTNETTITVTEEDYGTVTTDHSSNPNKYTTLEGVFLGRVKHQELLYYVSTPSKIEFFVSVVESSALTALPRGSPCRVSNLEAKHCHSDGNVTMATKYHFTDLSFVEGCFDGSDAVKYPYFYYHPSSLSHSSFPKQANLYDTRINSLHEIRFRIAKVTYDREFLVTGATVQGGHVVGVYVSPTMLKELLGGVKIIRERDLELLSGRELEVTVIRISPGDTFREVVLR